MIQFLRCKLCIRVHIREVYAQVEQAFFLKTDYCYYELRNRDRIITAAVSESLLKNWGIVHSLTERRGGDLVPPPERDLVASLVDSAAGAGHALINNPNIGHIVSYDEIAVIAPGCLVLGWYEI